MSQELKGKVAWITGGGSGIGLAGAVIMGAFGWFMLNGPWWATLYALLAGRPPLALVRGSTVIGCSATPRTSAGTSPPAGSR